ncbi:hypothetical protein NE686_18065 [Tissierella carlieri]|uniref:Uncharacterized protein n=1 Tax=Tissierella carlieri TaxID=689904 RepID=A0ABT1SF70_9FIRM|nr:hypothetical protein [Tissierella carlieri]MCQ4925012.1 hypothetical protein [Tissierella carlieri]
MKPKHNQGLLYGEENDKEIIFETFEALQSKQYNHLFVLGRASKVITFKEGEFKKELAPTNANIEYIEINKEKFVRMTYTYN